MKKYMVFMLLLVVVSILTAGCGETINGLSKDLRRINKGVKTVFMRGD